MGAPQPACVPCGMFYKPERNGQPVEEGMPTTDGWKPYKLWLTDKWKCRGCGNGIIVGYGRKPIAYQHEPDYAKMRDGETDIIVINDC